MLRCITPLAVPTTKMSTTSLSFGSKALNNASREALELNMSSLDFI
jgi:hypothetical protein